MFRKLALSILAVLLFAPALSAKPTVERSIVDVALEVNAATKDPVNDPDGEFATLIAAVLAADPAVLATLSGKGQFTVFAPTDAAFAALGLDSGNVGSLPQDALTGILLYHVTHGRRLAEEVVASEKLRTLSKSFLGVWATGTDAYVIDQDASTEDARIIITDVEADNGVIHAIDNVLLP